MVHIAYKSTIISDDSPAPNEPTKQLNEFIRSYYMVHIGYNDRRSSPAIRRLAMTTLEIFRESINSWRATLCGVS